MGTDYGFGAKTVADTGITFGMMIDYDSDLLGRYTRAGSGVILFPLAYLVDKAGIIQKIYTQDEPTLPDLKAEVEKHL